MEEYIEKPDIQYILHIKSDKKVEKRLIDFCLDDVLYVFLNTGLTADVQPVVRCKDCIDRPHCQTHSDDFYCAFGEKNEKEKI